MFDSRLFHFIKKELIQLFRDPRMLLIALLAPVFQLLILGYVASTDIKHVKTVVFDENRSAYSRTYLESFANSGYFDLDHYTDKQKEITWLLDSDRAELGLHIPYDFAQRINRGETAKVQALIDGSNAYTAMTILNYISQINFNNSQQYLQQRMDRLGLRGVDLIDLRLRVWYNPEIKSINFMVPSIFAQLLMIISIILTSSSIVKEKEKGTMEMLAVTPLKPYELIFGKLIPFAAVAIVDVFLVLLLSTFWFNVPIKGSILQLFLLSGVFLMSGLGLGLLISSMARTERQASMANNLALSPMFMLSGFVFPIANMPWLMQMFTYFIPVRYLLEIVRSLFLKGVGIRYLWQETLALTVLGALILGLSIVQFKKKLE